MGKWAVIRPIGSQWATKCSCGNERLVTELTEHGHRVKCEACGRCGGTMQSRMDACRIWNWQMEKQQKKQE